MSSVVIQVKKIADNLYKAKGKNLFIDSQGFQCAILIAGKEGGCASVNNGIILCWCHFLTPGYDEITIHQEKKAREEWE